MFVSFVQRLLRTLLLLSLPRGRVGMILNVGCLRLQSQWAVSESVSTLGEVHGTHRRPDVSKTRLQWRSYHRHSVGYFTCDRRLLIPLLLQFSRFKNGYGKIPKVLFSRLVGLWVGTGDVSVRHLWGPTSTYLQVFSSKGFPFHNKITVIKIDVSDHVRPRTGNP